jgi:hypothetical protein
VAGGNGIDHGRDEGLDTSSAAIRFAVATGQLACELAMLVLLALAGWDLGNDGLVGISLAVLYPAIALLIWAAWLAPRADHRLPDPWRLLVQIALFTATGTAVALAGHLTTGIAFAVVACVAFSAQRLLPA